MWGTLVAQCGWGVLWGVPVILISILIVNHLGDWIVAGLYRNRTGPDASE
jgi:hypothetical protein